MIKYVGRYLLKIALWLAYGYSGFMIIYLILRLTVWDSFWVVAFASNFIPGIFLPLFMVPFIALGSGKQHRWFFISSSIACFLILGWVHLKYWSPQAISANNFPQSLKILTLNSSWNKTTPASLIALIEEQQPELVFLQEITAIHYNQAFPKLKTLYPYQAGAPGLALLSKYPILFNEIIHLAGHREFQERAILQINQQRVVVYNMQATAPWIRFHKIIPGMKFKLPVYEYGDRTAEIQDLLKRIQQETEPAIVVGDFNMNDQAQDYSVLAAVLQDAFQQSGRGFGFTWPHGWPLNFLIKRSHWQLNYPLFRLDYIWYSQQWRSKSTEVVSPTGSDHLPVVTELVEGEIVRGKGEKESGNWTR
ncbi:MAG: endonuclease/exonuclease/phosphatase family protein [Actinomycetota bacterium]